jgi:hypothetical protein
MDIYEKATELHILIFPEEYDYMKDSYSEMLLREKGENPTSLEYQEKIKTKRKLLGVPQLTENGMSLDNTTYVICLNEIIVNENGTTTDWTEKLNQLSLVTNLEKINFQIETNKKSLFIEDIDPENPETWTDLMIENAYKKMVAVDKWELEKSIPFEEFKMMIFEDKGFARLNAPRKGMDTVDYNPWITS